MRTKTIECLECGVEIECEVEHDDAGYVIDIPDACPTCGASFDVPDYDYREDFCRGT